MFTEAEILASDIRILIIKPIQASPSTGHQIGRFWGSFYRQVLMEHYGWKPNFIPHLFGLNIINSYFISISV